MLTPEDDARLIAAVHLVGRTGAKEFEIGYLHEDVPPSEAAWYAHARYKGARITEENHASPVEAAEALARRLLTGARCKCGKLVALRDDGAFAFTRSRLSDGSEWSAGDAARAGQCRWRRDGRVWVSGCGRRGGGRADTVPAAKGARLPEGHTARILAAALEAAGAPRDMIDRAERGYYHDYLSPLAAPAVALVTELHAVANEELDPEVRAALFDLRADVMAGRHDASKAEGSAWAASPEGRETLRELGADGGSDTGNA
jgi:hypothetical protein